MALKHYFVFLTLTVDFIISYSQQVFFSTTVTKITVLSANGQWEHYLSTLPIRSDPNIDGKWRYSQKKKGICHEDKKL